MPTTPIVRATPISTSVVASAAWPAIGIGAAAFGMYQVGVTLGSSQLASPCTIDGRCSFSRCGRPMKPATVAPVASTTSGTVIVRGDSCACFAVSLRSSPPNTRK